MQAITSPKIKDLESIINLAARAMLQNVLIVSGNKIDYPSCIFNVQSIFPIEQGNDTFKNYYLLEFDKFKFEENYKIFLNAKFDCERF